MHYDATDKNNNINSEGLDIHYHISSYQYTLSHLILSVYIITSHPISIHYHISSYQYTISHLILSDCLVCLIFITAIILYIYIIYIILPLIKGPSWSWSYGSWIFNYLCNQCLSPLKFKLHSWRVLDTTLYDSLSVTWSWFSLVCSTNKNWLYNITEILLKVALNTIMLPPLINSYDNMYNQLSSVIWILIVAFYV
jgi:hypothetical protein